MNIDQSNSLAVRKRELKWRGIYEVFPNAKENSPARKDSLELHSDNICNSILESVEHCGTVVKSLL